VVRVALRPALAFFVRTSGVVLPGLAAFWLLGARFLWLAPLFEGAFSGAPGAPCSALSAAWSASAFVMLVLVILSAPGWRMTIHPSGQRERQGESDLRRRN